MSVRRQGVTLFSALLILVATSVSLQLWLLMVSMEALLSGRPRVLLSAASASTILLLLNAGLLRYVLRFDREQSS